MSERCSHALEAPPNASGDYFTLASTVLRPYSRGTVTIKSGSTFDKPVIDPNYLADERDVKVSLDSSVPTSAFFLGPNEFVSSL